MRTALPPFQEDWSDLEPDPDWPVPVLTAGWELIEGRKRDHRDQRREAEPR